MERKGKKETKVVVFCLNGYLDCSSSAWLPKFIMDEPIETLAVSVGCRFGGRLLVADGRDGRNGQNALGSHNLHSSETWLRILHLPLRMAAFSSAIWATMAASGVNG